MGGSITGALRTAQSGLLTNQSALEAVAHNIANVNTEGYSRKTINFSARVVNGVGAGVEISEITRIVDENLLKNLRQELGNFNSYDSRAAYYDRMQELFGKPGDNTSLSHIVSNLTVALETLALEPDKSLSQSEVVRRAEDVMQKLRNMSIEIQDLRLQADQNISTAVTSINVLSASIGDLNDKIVRYSASGRDVTDLKDKRDTKLDEMSKLIDTTYFYRSDGDVVVFTAAGRTLVDNVPSTLTHIKSSSVTPTTTHAEGDFTGLYIGTSIAGNDITTGVTGGRVEGFIDLRDNILPNLQSQIDELAAEIRDTVNQVHNRGTPFPGMQTMTGTRNFVDPATQQFYLDPTSSVDDVAITLFDSSGDQSATRTLNTIMSVDAAYSSRGAGNDWTINAVAAELQTWLQANGAATATVSAATGKMVITLNSTTMNLAFRDETATAVGSTAGDAEIGFDANGDNVVDETISGFSNFFGFNDFFVDGLTDNIYESNVIDNSFSSTAATVSFGDSTGSLGSVVIAAGDGLTEIKDKINNANIGVTAAVVPDGSGNRLRISHDDGASMTVTQAAGNTLLTTLLDMHRADVRVSSSLSVRSDMITTPANVTTGSVQWDANRGMSGEYLMSSGDDSIAEAMATRFIQNNNFDAAGGLAGLNTSFENFATAILANNSSMANENETDRSYLETLSESLKQKSDTVRGVNLDEEMSNLILLEQAYSAAARLITVIQKMFEALDRAIG